MVPDAHNPTAAALRAPIILDIEASGFGPEGYPIEVGFVHDQLKFCTLIRPQPDWQHWAESAEAVHGIKRDDLVRCGRPVAWVASNLNRLLADSTVYTDGWVVDHPWLIQLFEAAGQEMQFRLSALEMILSEAQIGIWEREKAFVLRDLSGLRRHRASSDAQIIRDTWLRTAQLVASRR